MTSGNSSHRPPQGHLPDFIVIGALKSGTTSLDFYLDRHPQIRTAPGKEVRFFAEDEPWSKGVDWYRSHFRGEADIYGEVCATYASYPTHLDVPQKMYSVIPDAKLIYLLRDPIERIVSQYVHRCADGHEDRSFDTVVREAHADDDYICRSAYHRQLERFLECYRKSDILVVLSEELLHDRQSTLRRVFRFLGVNEDHESPLNRVKLHQSSRKTRLTPTGARISRLPTEVPTEVCLPQRVAATLWPPQLHCGLRPAQREDADGSITSIDHRLVEDITVGVLDETMVPSGAVGLEDRHPPREWIGRPV